MIYKIIIGIIIGYSLDNYISQILILLITILWLILIIIKKPYHNKY